MKIGFVGLGKLGLPVAVAIQSMGHEVWGSDTSQGVRDYLVNREVPYKEEGLQKLLDAHDVKLGSIPRIVEWADLIFVAVQTPHEPQYEGNAPLPEGRADFDYSYLKKAIKTLASHAEYPSTDKRTNIVVISTCLPGTFEREIKPLLNDYTNYIYNPFFIAMGTVIQDFFNPEFVLIGGENTKSLEDFYSSIHSKPLFKTDITTAEGVKVFYNTFITAKTVLGNIYGEMAHKLGMNVDDIYQALSLATDRVISPKYLEAGMGDGGGCHPRDNIALSYIAQKLNLSHNIFEDLMQARQDHTVWFASMLQREHSYRGLPVTILGRSFKPETNIETGSPSKLLSNILCDRGFPHRFVEDAVGFEEPGIFFIGTKHERFRSTRFPKGSVVIDPFRYMLQQEGVELIRIGLDTHP